MCARLLRPLGVLSALPVLLTACGGGGGGSSVGPPAISGDAKVLAANDLGMHCMDREFAVFSLLPPFNVVQAQVVRRDADGPRLLGPAEVALRYDPQTDAQGSRNSTSLGGKTDFWQHASALYGAALAPGQGLTGLYMPGDASAAAQTELAYDAALGAFRAFGIPITPLDDALDVNPFPLLRISAQLPGGAQPAPFLDIVVPVAQETDCRSCHQSGGIGSQAAGVSWSSDPDLEVQAKRNILALHDLRNATSLAQQTPVLCAGCHYSAALDLAGNGPAGAQLGHASMSRAIHQHHGELLAGDGTPLFPPGGTAAQTCYQCHPGLQTQCDRGAMKQAGLECRDCHGDLLAVGGAFDLASGGSLTGANDGHARTPWADLPRCQSCHTGDALDHLSGAGLSLAPDGIRLMRAWRSGDPAASAILATNKRFAENTGKLSRFSKGHGGLLCTACHGSTHATWPTIDPAGNDNVAAQELQGHRGTIAECSVCHANSPGNSLGGPHGMHPIGGGWLGDAHGHLYQQSPSACKACHGADLNGTVLSRAAAERSFHTEEGSAHFAAGAEVGCGDCHGNPLH